MREKGGSKMTRYYTVVMLEELYRLEHPDFSEEDIKIRAKILHRQLNNMDVSWSRSNRRFYKHNRLYDFSESFF